ncbi:uncharacterized protein BDR25DRAFT_254743 [Lindgomyces ingoldianus]|uniref:Uncharacterized protein n=1 Tax=Lindgomyces ingoldianus TaxID=673940 RepID=A0ACB6R5V7_9PLEO|nr:uncharacterized protein BDR25DRAFT_254743 [Lindgomyces ingoldianus]KAF2474536.1 hypothetical protein BDR25DRAFT_254743 [Lindgomyces ingoldianus]
MTSETTTNAPAQNVSNIDCDVVDTDNQLPPLPNPLPKEHPQFLHCMPPNEPTYRDFSLFLAGSIEMGNAIRWQQHMANILRDLPITITNPRRGHWDKNARPLPTDKTFRAQVEWELNAMTKATVICFFFDKNTKSPVTLLELGLWASSGKIVVCCPDGFWKGGNVDIVCERYKVPCVKTFEALVPEVKKMLKVKGMDI